MCPDFESFDLRYDTFRLEGYVMPCTYALDLLQSGDPESECEQDTSVVEEYVNLKVDLQTAWLSEYFSLDEYRAGNGMAWNSFSVVSNLLDTSAKYFSRYELLEVQSDYYDSRLFESNNWIASHTGTY